MDLTNVTRLDGPMISTPQERRFPSLERQERVANPPKLL